MIRWKERHLLLSALVLLGTSGLIIHLRAHQFRIISTGGSYAYRWPFLAAAALSVLDVLLVSALFCSRRTAVYGYLLNGLIVIYGTVMMGQYSIVELTAGSAHLEAWILKSTLPDIALAWADFLIGKLLYHAWHRDG